MPEKMKERETASAGDVGRRIRELRTLAGISQFEFAVRVGVSQSAVAAWERGTYMVGGENLSAICRLTGASADWILFGEQPNSA